METATMDIVDSAEAVGNMDTFPNIIIDKQIVIDLVLKTINNFYGWHIQFKDLSNRVATSTEVDEIFKSFLIHNNYIK